MVGWWIDVGWASIVWFIVCTSILIGGGGVIVGQYCLVNWFTCMGGILVVGSLLNGCGI